MNNSQRYFIIFALGFCACSETTRLDSDDYNSAEERIEVLKEQIRCFSEIKDAEFELFNVNGFKGHREGMVPGASSSRYSFAVRVDTADLGNWREGMTKIDPEHTDDTWTKEIVTNREENWRTTCEPTYYTRQGSNLMMVEYTMDGIIFKRVIVD